MQLAGEDNKCTGPEEPSICATSVLLKCDMHFISHSQTMSCEYSVEQKAIVLVPH